ncbi:MAG TPA: molecular chaperone DnaK [Geobacter sp.]|nr:molecular chaperone DnaK [Geobacter sp.]HCE66547.1 molecular chaperone DnaK [Geobacter sp.]
MSADHAEENTEVVTAEQAPLVGGQEGAAAVSAPQLKDQKWEEIRLLLTKIKEDTLREISKSVRNGTEAVAAIEPGGDIYDQASSERDRELGLLLGDREREKVHNIDEALLRIDEGEYGICEECDEEIPLGRLKAMPFTRHCVKCKSDLEKMQAQTKRVEEERAYREIPIGSEEDEG